MAILSDRRGCKPTFRQLVARGTLLGEHRGELESITTDQAAILAECHGSTAADQAAILADRHDSEPTLSS